MANDSFYYGTSGLVLPVPQLLYPLEFQGKSRLTFYASLFNSLEVNSSFYKTPKAATVVKWAEAVPAGFQFTFKLSKEISHAKLLEYNTDTLYHFMETISQIDDRKGCLLIQFPPSLKVENLNKLKDLLTVIESADISHSWKVAVEFRNQSWYQPEVYDLLEQQNATMVVHDLPASVTPIIDSNVSFRYVRFHGPGGKYRGSYHDEFLNEYATHIKKWIGEGKQVYCYFNNTMGDAYKNAQTLYRLVNTSL